MAGKKAIRWRAEQLDRFADEPDIEGADKLARRLGPIVSAMWNAGTVELPEESKESEGQTADDATVLSR
jgi:hypothetical protein